LWLGPPILNPTGLLRRTPSRSAIDERIMPAVSDDGLIADGVLAVPGYRLA
jgi:hypothetical protein